MTRRPASSTSPWSSSQPSAARSSGRRGVDLGEHRVACRLEPPAAVGGLDPLDVVTCVALAGERLPVPAATSCSAPNARSVSSSTYRRPGARITSERSTSCVERDRRRRRRRRRRSPPPSAAVNGPAKTERSAKIRCRRRIEQVERPRHRRARASRGARTCGSPTRAAGSGDRARRRPRRRRACAAGRRPARWPAAARRAGARSRRSTASSSGPGSNSGATARARSTNSCTAGASPADGRQRRHAAQLLAGDPQPLPARRHDRHVRDTSPAGVRPGRRPDRGRARSCRATARSRCRRARRPPGRRDRRPGRPSIASAAATASTADSSLAVASSHITTGRSGRSARSRRPISPSRRVLPTPPGPIRVTSRWVVDASPAPRRRARHDRRAT